MKRLSAIVFLFIVILQSMFSDDRRMVLSILKEYCPDGYYIVEQDVKATGFDFMQYWDSSTEDSKWDSINTIVHEMTHGYQRDFAEYDSTYYFVSKDIRIMVPLTNVFPSNRMAGTFPKSLRTTRFDYYINTNEKDLASNSQGAYGILNEMAAYLSGTKASWELLPYFRKQGASASWMSFFNGVNGSLYGIAEFKFFLLKYLLYARDREPGVYRNLINNKPFVRAFLSLDKAANSFLGDYFKRRDDVYNYLKGLGFDVWEEDEGEHVFLTIARSSENTVGASATFIKEYNLLALEMQKEQYQSLMRFLNNGKEVAPFPLAPNVFGTSRSGDTSVTSTISTTSQAAMVIGQTGSSALPKSTKTEIETDIKPAPAFDNPEIKPVNQHNMAPSILLFNRSKSDTKGDVPEGFIDIVKGDVTAYSDKLVVDISLDASLDNLSFNSSFLEDNSLEYEWSCRIDFDGDRNDDFSLSVSTGKYSGSKPQKGSVEKMCQTDLWKISGNSSSYIDSDISSNAKGSSLIITLYGSPAFPLDQITNKTRFTIETYHDSGKTFGRDSLDL